jgi:hypothetical protein
VARGVSSTRSASVRRQAMAQSAEAFRPDALKDWREFQASLPHLHWDWARPCHICTGAGLAPATSAPGLGSPLPHLRPATSAPGLSSLLPHLRRD